MTAVFTTDDQRAQAIELRRLLIRLQNGDGEDRALGADIVNAAGAPATLGDPTGCLDCALYLADHFKMNQVDTLARAVINLRERVREGWKKAGEISNSDAARAITVIVVRTQIAKLEGQPV